VAKSELGLPKGVRIEAGAICVPQRFNSALALAPHLHALVTDGVWIHHEPSAAPTFRALPAPSKAEIAAVAWSTCQRTVLLLKKRGLWLDADETTDRLAHEQPLLAALAVASIAGVLAMGPNAGQRPMRLFGRAARDDSERYEKSPNNAYGFDLHAGARAATADLQARQRLCRYLLRPPLSSDRLRRRDDGNYEIVLKRVWDDGTAAIVVSGQELMARLALLVPPPRVHGTRYFGCFAPRSKFRRLIVPAPPPALLPTTTPEVACGVERDGDTDGGGATGRYRLSSRTSSGEGVRD